MHLDGFLLVGIPQGLGHVLTDEHDLVVYLASANLAENFACENLNIVIHDFCELFAREVSEIRWPSSREDFLRFNSVN
jgi:hypothetical protein